MFYDILQIIRSRPRFQDAGMHAGFRHDIPYNKDVTLKVLVHKAEEGGYWAEIPALPGCFTQAETLDELRDRARETIEAYLGLDEERPAPADGEVWEIAV